MFHLRYRRFAQDRPHARFENNRKREHANLNHVPFWKSKFSVRSPLARQKLFLQKWSNQSHFSDLKIAIFCKIVPIHFSGWFLMRIARAARCIFQWMIHFLSWNDRTKFNFQKWKWAFFCESPSCATYRKFVY